MNDSIQYLQKGDGVLVVDLQWDFCPGGRLPVPDGDQVIPDLNEWIIAALSRDLPVYASRDWHPKGHISFQERGGLWPPHCIQDTDGATFHPELHMNNTVLVITKGTRFDRDQNSAFDRTGFKTQLEYDRVRRLYIGGLALDECVLASVMDALNAGLEVRLLKSATRPIDDEKGRRALERMMRFGVPLIS